jgi:ligand-binding sensor domain-containing protein
MKRSVLVAIACALGIVAVSRAEMNPRYFTGDWVAYTSVRYVHAAVVTLDYVYFGTRGGVARYDRHRDRWLPALTSAEGLPANNVRRLAYDDATDELWAETPLGISVYRPTFREWQDARDFPDSLEQPWQRFDVRGLSLPFGFDAITSGYLTDPQLRSYEILGFVKDSWGTSWIGTWGQFVWTIPPASFGLMRQEWGLFQNNVQAVFLDSAAIFFGGPNYYDGANALTVWDTISGDWRYFEARYNEGFASDNIERIVGERGGRYLWQATDRGLVRMDRRSADFRTYGLREGLVDERVHALALDGDILWIGTESGIDGLYIPRDSLFHATTDAVRNSRIYDIELTSDVVWLATDRGLMRLAKPTPEWRRYYTYEGPLAGRIRALTSTGRKLYAGSDRGIAIVDLAGRDPVEVFESPSILPDDNIYDLAVTADSIVWAATASGLLRLVPATHERRVFTTDDGLLDLFVQRIVVDGDYLWLGTAKGANRFRWKNPFRVD